MENFKLLGYLQQEETIEPAVLNISKQLVANEFDLEKTKEYSIYIWKEKGEDFLEAKIYAESEEMVEKFSKFAEALVKRIHTENITNINDLNAEGYLKIMRVYFPVQLKEIEGFLDTKAYVVPDFSVKKEGKKQKGDWLITEQTQHQPMFLMDTNLTELINAIQQVK